MTQYASTQPYRDPSNPYNLRQMPGESESDFRKRLANTSTTLAEAEAQQFAERQAGQSRSTLEEQKGIQKSRLSDLATLLAQQEHTKFNQAIPEIAETAQGQGFLETSGFGNALARERTKLASDTAYRLGEQGLADRDFEVNAVGDINKNTQNVETAGIERRYGLEDLTRSEQLARELARLGQPAPARGPSSFDRTMTALQTGATVVGAVGKTK